MGNCRLYEILFNFVPVKAWQDFLIRHHFDRCADCQKRLSHKEEVQSIFLSPDVIRDRRDARTEFLEFVKGRRKIEKNVLQPRQRWAYGAVIFVAVVITGLWFMFTVKQDGTSDLPERFKINYIRIEDKPARAFLFQPKDSNTIFVWAERNTEGE